MRGSVCFTCVLCVKTYFNLGIVKDSPVDFVEVCLALSYNIIIKF